MKIIEIREQDEGLAENPHQIHVAGPLPNLRFPALCPNCGVAAQQALEIARPFMRTGGADRLRRFEIGRVQVPFCPPCIADHRRELDPLTSTQQALSVLRNELAWAGLGLVALTIFLAAQMFGSIAEDPKGSWPLVALLVMLFGAAWSCLKTAWEKGEQFRLPEATRVTSSFDFGDDLSNDFGTYSRLYSIRNAGFASAFAQLNRETSEALLGPQEKARTNRNFILGLILMALAVTWSILSR